MQVNKDVLCIALKFNSRSFYSKPEKEFSNDVLLFLFVENFFRNKLIQPFQCVMNFLKFKFICFPKHFVDYMK